MLEKLPVMLEKFPFVLPFNNFLQELPLQCPVHELPFYPVFSSLVDACLSSIGSLHALCSSIKAVHDNHCRNVYCYKRNSEWLFGIPCNLFSWLDSFRPLLVAAACVLLPHRHKRRCSLIPKVTCTRIAFFTAVNLNTHVPKNLCLTMRGQRL